MFEILVTFFFQDLFCLLEAAFRIRIRIHPDPLHLTGSGSTLILASDPVPDPDPLRFLFPDPDPAKCSGSGWIRVARQLFPLALEALPVALIRIVHRLHSDTLDA